ncbi:URC4/urg3 family protein [Microbacteriaceae bacterium K1510]|nr:URC4/urg3 family protein [Microbacteriaceae bacterium K1510]
MLSLARADALPHFRFDAAKLKTTADYVADVIRANYPDLRVPLHARWRHFVFGGRDLWREIAARASWPDKAAQARAAFDLAIVSVLLDAGAGPDWRYRDEATGLTIGRSEGLALASLRMFEAGLFSADARDPLRADAGRLVQLTADELAQGFQVSEGNPLAGLEGRAALLARLGRAMADNAAVFAKADAARAGGLFDHLLEQSGGKTLPAPAILRSLLLHLGTIWQNRLTLAGVPLGDTWRHRAIKRSDASNGLMPLHKLSQWLSYSLIEPLQAAGVTVTDVDGLTGLAEYRNGGLLIDSGLLTLREPDKANAPLPVDSELVVEWRGLTVALLDAFLPLVRERLGVTATNFPLGSLLEGGTWAAGRKIAKEKRADGAPPLTVVSDGTVF